MYKHNSYIYLSCFVKSYELNVARNSKIVIFLISPDGNLISISESPLRQRTSRSNCSSPTNSLCSAAHASSLSGCSSHFAVIAWKPLTPSSPEIVLPDSSSVLLGLCQMPANKSSELLGVHVTLALPPVLRVREHEVQNSRA